jgi:type II secretory ATPase GspE/PulE/Tfp pilus assembly ATPase PilB-like protein/8-oxo-dGTP pyrophosphatase MutT (NUDIX family)
VSTILDPSPTDVWLLATLRDLLPQAAIDALDARVATSYWETAVGEKLVTEDELLKRLSARTHIRVAGDLLVSSAAREVVPERLARRFGILPLSISASVLDIATSNPYDLDCEQTLAFAASRAVRMSLASPARIAERIEEVYAPVKSVSRILNRSPQSSVQPVLEKVDDSDGAIDQSEAERPVIKLVDHIVAEGIATSASDIHLEAGEHGISVRYRIDGMLREVMVLPKAVGIPLVSRIKIMAQMDIADRLRPQGGRARVAINGTRVDLRVSTLPASHGEKVVIRILDSRAGIRSIESLGLDPVDGPRMQKLFEAREGLVLVTGPTGSGKTTTLYAALRLLQKRGVNIITVEDPVEYRIPGIVQVQIHEKAGLTFASALRSVLRQDPDVLLIGEIRDRETAAIALQASLTGHLVFATLHTNDACSSITRLTDLGVDPAKLAGALKGVVAQRLIRRLCPACKQVANAGVPRSLVESIPESSMIYMPVGCLECSLTGYRGRVAVTEVLVTTPEIERAIAGGEATDRLTAVARETGTRSMWGCGAEHLLSGATSAQELVRVLEPEGARLHAHEHTQGYDLQRPIIYERSVPTNKTKIVAGVVDVYVIRRNGGDWRVLTLQRAADTRRPNSWEMVHGKIDADERPEHAAGREVREETGLGVDALYNLTVNPFYLHESQTVQLAIVFVAFVADDSEVALSEEHQRYEWLSVDDACGRFTWPRAAHALRDAHHLLSSGDAGPVEDVLRVV